MDFGTKPLSKSEQVSLGNIAAAAVGAARRGSAAGTMAGESWPLQIVEHVRERSALVCHTQCRDHVRGLTGWVQEYEVNQGGP